MHNRYTPKHAQQRAARFQSSAAPAQPRRGKRNFTAAMLIAVGGGLAGIVWFEQGQTWRIQDVQVRGNTATPLEAILSASALLGAHFHHADLDAAAQRVRSLPGIAGARITCRWEWKASCVIDVQMATVAAVWEQGGRTWWSDPKGGLHSAAGDLSAPVRIRVVEGKLPLQQGRLPEALVRAVRELVEAQPEVRYYEYSERFGLLWLMDDRQLVRLGDASREGIMREKLKQARELQLALELRGTRASIIDVRHLNQPFYVR